MKRRRTTLPIRGCAAQKQKLTRAQVQQIKKILLYEKLTRERDGRTKRPPGMRKRIAERFGISLGMVRMIIENRRHRHVKVQIKRKL